MSEWCIIQVALGRWEVVRCREVVGEYRTGASNVTVTEKR